MTLLLLSIALLVLIKVATPKVLIWEDNFDTLDPKKWRHLVTGWRGGNNEFQYYRNDRKNSYVSKGSLKIKVTPASAELSDAIIRKGSYQAPGCNMEPCKVMAGGGEILNPMFSARLITKGLVSFKGGCRIEVRAKLPAGDWLWPAIWLLPVEDYYGGTPMSGEIDVVESRGNKNLRNPDGTSAGIDTFGSTLHWGTQQRNAYERTNYRYKLPKGDFSQDFHVFALEWTKNYMAFSVDNKEYGRVTPPKGGFWELGRFTGRNIWAKGTHMAPFDRPFYLVLNVAVGGSFFGNKNWIMNNKPYPRPWDLESRHPMLQFYEAQAKITRTWTNPIMEVDYVRVYKA